VITVVVWSAVFGRTLADRTVGRGGEFTVRGVHDEGIRVPGGTEMLPAAYPLPGCAGETFPDRRLTGDTLPERPANDETRVRSGDPTT
jgi:hypothetical protein